MFHSLHPSVEIGEVHDAGHVGLCKLDAAFCGIYGGHGYGFVYEDLTFRHEWVGTGAFVQHGVGCCSAL